MNPADISEYIEKFYGYGSWDHPIWFVGMEEGGCPSLREFEHRLNSWLKSGRKELIDARSHHEAIYLGRWFNPKAPLQKTWEKLIRIYLTLQGRPADKESVRRFQIEDFGKLDSGFTSLELFSLPSVSLNSWIYSDLPNLPFLVNRQVYQYYLYPKRAELLRNRIKRHTPSHVIIYGTSYLPEWEGIVMKKFAESALKDAYETRVGNTLVLVIPHPVARGIPQSYWTDVGNYLQRN